MDGSEAGAGAPSWPRWLALFGAAVAVRLATQLPLWAFERGVLGPRDAGQRILLGLPLMALRVVRDGATVVAVYAGGTLLNEARRRWLAYQTRLRVLGPLSPDA